MRHALIAFFSAVTFAAMTLQSWAAELVMIDQTGCHYCERWTDEIGHIYPKTTEGKFAPLRRVNIRAIPDDLQLTTRPAFTPTFILIEDGKELGRIEGYPGADFFWPLLSDLLKKSPDYTDTGS